MEHLFLKPDMWDQMDCWIDRGACGGFQRLMDRGCRGSRKFPAHREDLLCVGIRLAVADCGLLGGHLEEEQCVFDRMAGDDDARPRTRSCGIRGVHVLH